MDYTGKNALFLLIKSLSFSEKKHFRQFANKLGSNEETLYISLFDLLQKQEVYKPGIIKKKLKIEKDANYRKLKNYLYQILLKSLRSLKQTSPRVMNPSPLSVPKRPKSNGNSFRSSFHQNFS